MALVNDVSWYSANPPGQRHPALLPRQIDKTATGKAVEIDLLDPSDLSGNATLHLSLTGNVYDPVTFNDTVDGDCVSGNSGACSARSSAGSAARRTLTPTPRAPGRRARPGGLPPRSPRSSRTCFWVGARREQHRRATMYLELRLPLPDAPLGRGECLPLFERQARDEAAFDLPLAAPGEIV